MAREAGYRPLNLDVVIINRAGLVVGAAEGRESESLKIQGTLEHELIPHGNVYVLGIRE
jgi:hypothetical protein